MDKQSEINRLKWRSRRGLLELDLLLVPFLEAKSEALSPPDQADYTRLLEEEDLDIYDWIQHRSPTPPEFVGILRLIRQFHGL